MIGVNEHATVEIYVGCDFTMALANGRCVSTWTRFNHLHLTSTVIILSILVNVLYRYHIFTIPPSSYWILYPLVWIISTWYNLFTVIILSILVIDKLRTLVRLSQYKIDASQDIFEIPLLTQSSNYGKLK